MTGCIAQDSANIKAGMEHDHVANKFVGGDESYKFGTFSRMFHSMAQEVKKSTAQEEQADANNAVRVYFFDLLCNVFNMYL